ncbi:phosphotransferase [Mucilaginibacter sp. HC2]|uniref:phosphotransferase n=1 Tax=Mucilaginibacter inviolabilis TaxID=2714892 RepID=UPI00140A69B8|nr:phosphotransferase [Mucilaginibacter inviolabilis]NHA04471.1 phosphotransferase [Mucilaginibacter inviolabilis]
MKTDLLTTTIPESKFSAVKNALKYLFNHNEIEDIQLLTGGLSSALVYRMTVEGKDYLLRIVMHADEMHDPPRQHICMGLAASANIAPHVYYSNDEDALAITDFVQNKSLREGFASGKDLITALGNTIKAMHELPLFPKLVNFLDGVDIFIEQFKALHIFPEHVTAEYFSLYAEIQKAYPRHDTDMVSSHNDLNPNNILFDGKKIWVIDWEAAFQNDRYVDLAIVAKTFVHNQEDEAIFLQTYFGEQLDEYKRARFFLMQQICRMYYAMIMLKLAAAQKPANHVHDTDMVQPGMAEFGAMLMSGKILLDTYEGKLQYGKILLNTMLAAMKTERFKAAIDMMRVF